MESFRNLVLAFFLALGAFLLPACSGGGSGGGGVVLSGTNSTVEVSVTTGALADGVEVVTITVTVRDTNNNPVQGQTVELSSTGTGNTLTQPGGTTNANGEAVGTIATSVPETKTISAVINPGASEVAIVLPVDTEFLPALSGSDSTIAVDQAFGTPADGIETVTITVTVEDVFGVPVPGQTVELAATGSGNGLTQPAGLTNASGVATGTLVSTVAELKIVSAVINPGASSVAVDDTVEAEFVWLIPATYYVRTSGSDANDGVSPATAWATISHAASQVAPGDEVHVGGGTYSEAVDITTTGLVADPIFFFADTAGFQTSDEGPVIVDAAGFDYGFRLDSVAYVGIHGFTVTGAAPGVSRGGGVDIDSCNSVVVSDCVLYGNDRGIHATNSVAAALDSNRISNNLGGDAAGIVLNNDDGFLIRNNLIYNNAGYGIVLVASVTNFMAQANTLYAGGSDQFHEMTGGGASLGILENNIITDGLADGIEVTAGSFVLENNNCVWNNAGLDYNDNAGGSLDGTSFSLDPLLVDPDGADNQLGGAQGEDDVFLVGMGSSTVDAGDVAASGVFLYFGGPLTGFTTRSDGALDGVSPDGALVNLGYHVAAVVDPIGNLSTDDARLFYGSGDEVQVLGRVWDDDTTTWLPPSAVDPTIGTIKWVLSEVSPLVQQEELLAIFSDTGVSTELTVRLWNGRQWLEAGGHTDPIRCQIQSANANQRGFDIIYEDLSGDAMVVYSDDTANPVYRTYSRGVWSSEASVFAASPGTGTVLWVEIACRAGTDELALVCLSDTQDLTAVIWDGDAWDEAGTATLLDSQITTTTLSRAFDLAYEQVSGDLLVAWGHTVLGEEIRFSEKQAGSGTFVNGQANSADAIGVIVRLAPDPSSNRIACALSEGSIQDDAVGMIWDGSDFVEIAEFDLSASPTARDISVSWVGTTGLAVYIYKDNDGGGSLDWAQYEVGGWHKQPDEPLPGVGDLEFIQAQSFPNQNKVMVVMSDSTGKLFALTYDGTDWTVTNGGAALENDLPDLGSSSQPFHFALKE